MEAVSKEFVAAATSLYRWHKFRLVERRSKFSPRKFTLPQIYALIHIRAVPIWPRGSEHPILPGAPEEVQVRFWENMAPIREVGGISYRRLTMMLRASKALRDALELTGVPNYSTLCKALKRASGQERRTRPP